MGKEYLVETAGPPGCSFKWIQGPVTLRDLQQTSAASQSLPSCGSPELPEGGEAQYGMPPREGTEQSLVLWKDRSVLGSMHPSTSLTLESTPPQEQPLLCE